MKDKIAINQVMNSFNIASHLPAMASAQPDTLAVAIQKGGNDYPRYSYRELDEASDIISRGLQEIGILKGTRTVLMVKPGLDAGEYLVTLVVGDPEQEIVYTCGVADKRDLLAR